jgi:DNA-binding NarL/FixJ family response regulator
MKILVVDDHPLILEALAQLLPQLSPGTQVCVARDRAEAESALDDDPEIGLVLLDLALPGTRGLDFLADLLLDYPGVPIVVLSATHDKATVTAALAAGARGYIPKTANPRDLVEALEKVVNGGIYLTTDVTDELEGNGVNVSAHELGLTMRQSDVLKLLVQGKPNKLICRDLKLSEGTVKVHVSAILKALRVHSRTQAVAELARRGISVETLAARRCNG